MKPMAMFYRRVMTRKATIKDIAREAGVSHATVSMIFSGKKKLSVATKNKVLSAARKLKYVPNLGASDLRRGESRVIGLVVNDLSNPIYGKMAQVAETIALANGYQVIVSDHQWNPEAEADAVRRMLSFRAKGLLWCGTEESEAALELLETTGAPSVIALDSWPKSYHGSGFGYDVEATGRLAVRHLVESGCRNPVLFTVNERLQNISSFVDLKKGFLDELRSLGVGGKRSVFNAGLSVEEGRETFHRLRASEPSIDGILAINELCAYGIMWAADELGISVGGDLALIGIGNHPVSNISRMSLTSISHSPEQIVRMAMTELLECFKTNRQPAMRLKLPGELIIRRSSRLSGTGKRK